jgi:hypothetical protein
MSIPLLFEIILLALLSDSLGLLLLLSLLLILEVVSCCR